MYMHFTVLSLCKLCSLSVILICNSNKLYAYGNKKKCWNDLYHSYNENDVDLSDIKPTRSWQLIVLTGYENKIISY